MLFTMRVVSKQRSELLCWIRDTSSILSTHPVQVLLSWFQARHLRAIITRSTAECSHLKTRLDFKGRGRKYPV